MASPVIGSFVFYTKADDESGPDQQPAIVTTSNEDYTLNLSIFNESSLLVKTAVVYDAGKSPGTWNFGE